MVKLTLSQQKTTIPQDILDIICDYSNIKIVVKHQRKAIKMGTIKYPCCICKKLKQFRQYKVFNSNGIILDCCKNALKCKVMDNDEIGNYSIKLSYEINRFIEEYGYNYQLKIDEDNKKDLRDLTIWEESVITYNNQRITLINKLREYIKEYK